MRRNVLRTALWCLFGILLVSAGFALLPACDFGLRPLFGLRYCGTAAKNDALVLERFRARNFEGRIHEAELRLAEKPACPKPPPPPIAAPPAPAPGPSLPPETKPDEGERLKIPKKITELKGCWESVAGDMPIQSDDEAHRPIGYVRECFCFNAAGRGVKKLLYTDGAKCRSPISAKLVGTSLEIHQPAFNCYWNNENRGLVRSKVTCRTGEDDSATCDTQDYGRWHELREGDQYRKVSEDHCG